MIEVRCYTRLEEVEPLREQIDRINLASARPDPFATFAFYQNVVCNDEFCAAGETWSLWFLTAFIDGQLVAYFPLKRMSTKVLGLRTHTVDFLVGSDADRPQIVADGRHIGAVRDAFFEYLLARRSEWSMLEFQQQEEPSPLLKLSHLATKSCVLRRWPNLDNATIVIQWPSLEAYFKAFSKKFRSNISRQMRTLLAAGEVEALSSSDPAVTPALFELCRYLEPRSWKQESDAAIERSPKRVEFFRRLLDADQPMRVSIRLLLLDGIPIAGLMNGRFGSRLYALHIVYDERLKKLGPGSAVLLLGVREAITDGFDSINLLGGFGYYKQRWLATLCPTYNAQIYRKGSLLFWRRMLGDCKRRLLRRAEEIDAHGFNPLRRIKKDDGDESSVIAPAAAIPQGERDRIRTLIQQARGGACEHLSAAQLALAMPFETRRAADV